MDWMEGSHDVFDLAFVVRLQLGSIIVAAK